VESRLSPSADALVSVARNAPKGRSVTPVNASIGDGNLCGYQSYARSERPAHHLIAPRHFLEPLWDVSTAPISNLLILDLARDCKRSGKHTMRFPFQTEYFSCYSPTYQLAPMDTPDQLVTSDMRLTNQVFTPPRIQILFPPSPPESAAGGHATPVIQRVAQF